MVVNPSRTIQHVLTQRQTHLAIPRILQLKGRHIKQKVARRRNLTAFQSDGISGDLETRAEGHYRVPKRDLIVGLQLLLQRRELQIANGMKFGPVLAREMAEMRVEMTPSGNEQYGAWREADNPLGC